MTSAPADSGVYLFVFDVAEPVTVEVGALGEIALPGGRHGYVGSARRALHARLSRHCRRRKPLRWHIDYLRRVAEPVGAIIWPWKRGRECRIARVLAATHTGRTAAPRFGASDCGCAGHLFVLSETGLDAVATQLARRMRTRTPSVLLFRRGRPVPLDEPPRR